ncbi:hypothetical protein NQD34_011735 [Periophthalmus magnuspinnatus]|nr:hypothetical protein NQD34_011735 [Periophthalmus magnuspinnatus]
MERLILESAVKIIKKFSGAPSLAKRTEGGRRRALQVEERSITMQIPSCWQLGCSTAAAVELPVQSLARRGSDVCLAASSGSLGALPPSPLSLPSLFNQHVNKKGN